MKILIVDDIEENLYLLEVLLKGSGYEVVTAENGVEALQKIKKETIDLIISDILMPRMDGFQLCKECKKDDSIKRIPFIFYTATYTDKKDEEFALNLGADKFIIKPQEPEIFLKILKEVIKEHKKEVLIAPKELMKEKEGIYFEKYNKRLIQKLEKKMLDLEKSEKHVSRLFNVLETIRNINQLIIRETNRSLLLQKACDILIKTRGYDSVWLGFLKDEKTFTIIVGSPLIESVSRLREQVMKGDNPPCIRKALVQKNLFWLINTYKECGDCCLKGRHGEEQSAIIRLEHNHKLLGLLSIKLATGVYIDKEEEGLLKELAGDIAFGLHNIEMEKKDELSEKKLQQSYQKLEMAMNAIIETMSKIVEAKDPYTAGHQQRVSQLATAIAKELNLSEDKIEGIRIASLIHDIGKIGLPTEILSKPTKLSDLEFRLIKEHPRIGYDILKSIDFSYPVAEIVLQHHERLNGSGYPNHLKGDQIFPEARILGVADVVEAMSSYRPYRPALGIDKALEEITQNRGILYDPEVVDICLKLFKKKRFKFE